MIFVCDVVRTMSAFQFTGQPMSGVPRQFLPPTQLMVPASPPCFMPPHPGHHHHPPMMWGHHAFMQPPRNHLVGPFPMNFTHPPAATHLYNPVPVRSDCPPPMHMNLGHPFPSSGNAPKRSPQSASHQSSESSPRESNSTSLKAQSSQCADVPPLLPANLDAFPVSTNTSQRCTRSTLEITASCPRGLNSPNYRSSRVVRLKKLLKAESSKSDTRFEKVGDVTEKWSGGDGDVVADNKKPRQRPYSAEFAQPATSEAEKMNSLTDSIATTPAVQGKPTTSLSSLSSELSPSVTTSASSLSVSSPSFLPRTFTRPQRLVPPPRNWKTAPDVTKTAGLESVSEVGGGNGKSPDCASVKDVVSLTSGSTQESAARQNSTTSSLSPLSLLLSRTLNERKLIQPVGRGRMMLERHGHTAGEVNRPGPITCGMFLCLSLIHI